MILPFLPIIIRKRRRVENGAWWSIVLCPGGFLWLFDWSSVPSMQAEVGEVKLDRHLAKKWAPHMDWHGV